MKKPETRETTYTDEFCKTQGPKLLVFAFKILRNKADAEDVVQEVWLHVFTAEGEFRGEATQMTYLYKIARNECMSLLKKESRNLDGLDGDRLFSAEVDPHQALENRELKEDVERRLTELPPIQSAALLLRIEEGMSYKEIADVLNVTEHIATVAITRGREKVQKTLKAKGITA